jgi:PAS domain S-box-containing protein
MKKILSNQDNPSSKAEPKPTDPLQGSETFGQTWQLDKRLYTSILQTALNGILLVDRTGRLLEANQTYCDMSGYTREVLLTMHLSDLDGCVSPDQSIQHLLYALDLGMNRLETLHYRSDHTAYDVEMCFHYVSEEDDVLVIVIRDISEQKQAEARLRDSENRFRALFDESNDGILLHDFEGNIQDANPKMQQMLGYGLEEFLPLKISMLHPEAERNTVQWALQEVAKNQRVKFTTCFIKKDGSVMDAEISAGVVEQDKKVIQGVVRDITEQKIATEKLKREMQLNAAMADITRKLLSEEYDVQQAADRILAFAKEFTGSYTGYISGRPNEMNQDKEKPFSVEPSPSDGVIAVPVMIGDTMVSRITLSKADSGFTTEEFQAVEKLATVYAVALRKERFDLEKEHSNFQSFQNQKLKAINNFAGNIAGHFKQICSPLVEYAEHLQKTLAGDFQVRTQINKIVNGIYYADDMAARLLSFSRQSWQEIKPIKLQPVVLKTIEKTRARLPGHINMESRVDADCCNIMAESLQLEQILTHLINNACRAMEDTGGTLTIGLHNVKGKPSDSPQAIENRRYIHLFVRDTGSGMNDMQLQNIFEPRLAVKPNQAYPGPGLPLIHSIIESYQGEIGIRSLPGQGTTVDIYLPVYCDEKKSVYPVKIWEIPTGTERILVVDDDPIILNLLTQLLQSLGYEIVAETDERQALKVFETRPDAFDLVLSDMLMSHMTGDILAEKIRGIRLDIPIVFCTGFSETVSHDRLTALGINALIMKPVVKSELAEVIRNVLNEHADRFPHPDKRAG